MLSPQDILLVGVHILQKLERGVGQRTFHVHVHPEAEVCDLVEDVLFGVVSRYWDVDVVDGLVLDFIVYLVLVIVLVQMEFLDIGT